MSRQEVKEAKKAHKHALKNIGFYIQQRDNMVAKMLESVAPDWGSVKLILINWRDEK